ncbi:MAG: peptide-methionine (S)-S-oxide reductase [Crocinitomicaceae bacterium]
MNKIEKIGFGGGCHWCTEGIFQSLIGIIEVEQGWIASVGEFEKLSEGVIVHFDPSKIELKVLIEIHLLTHASTSNHSMRQKYRSAVYTFNKEQSEIVDTIIIDLQAGFEVPVITQVLPFNCFESNIDTQLNYFYSKPNAPFCKSYIHPKISLILAQFGQYLNMDKVPENII